MAGRPAQRVGACRFVGQLPGAIMSAGGHHPGPASPVEQRVAALEALLTERGLVPAGFIEEITSRYESETGPLNGAKVVARSWVNPQYKQRLLADSTSAIAGLRRPGRRSHGGRGEHSRHPQCHRVHAVLVLSLAGARAAARLVQRPPVPGPDGPRAPDAASRDGLPAAR